MTRVMFGIPKHENSRDLTRFFSIIISSLFSGHKGGETPSLCFETPDLACDSQWAAKRSEPGAAQEDRKKNLRSKDESWKQRNMEATEGRAAVKG